MVVPVDPFEGGALDRFEAPPGIAPDDEFGLDPPMMDSARACLRLDRGAFSQESPTRPRRPENGISDAPEGFSPRVRPIPCSFYLPQLRQFLVCTPSPGSPVYRSNVNSYIRHRFVLIASGKNSSPWYS